ncbi:hypothetical protein AT05_08125 [Schleiferia thermophila str. Yellowstone]|jgi:hypothetical protein|nr:hypothetical protein AT05_08125 [Schleiferia thermophila str. Yellowstone]PMB31356.1 hypothetical protein CEN47_11610 [Fischerella thermalis CCMEE 5319]
MHVNSKNIINFIHYLILLPGLYQISYAWQHHPKDTDLRKIDLNYQQAGEKGFVLRKKALFTKNS